MDIVAWVLQVLLCLMFLIHAYQMLRPDPEQQMSRGMGYIVEMPAGLRVFAGVAEALAPLGTVTNASGTGRRPACRQQRTTAPSGRGTGRAGCRRQL